MSLLSRLKKVEARLAMAEQKLAAWDRLRIVIECPSVHLTTGETFRAGAQTAELSGDKDRVITFKAPEQR